MSKEVIRPRISRGAFECNPQTANHTVRFAVLLKRGGKEAYMISAHFSDEFLVLRGRASPHGTVHGFGDLDDGNSDCRAASVDENGITRLDVTSALEHHHQSSLANDGHAGCLDGRYILWTKDEEGSFDFDVFCH